MKYIARPQIIYIVAQRNCALNKQRQILCVVILSNYFVCRCAERVIAFTHFQFDNGVRSLSELKVFADSNSHNPFSQMFQRDSRRSSSTKAHIPADGRSVPNRWQAVVVISNKSTPFVWCWCKMKRERAMALSIIKYKIGEMFMGLRCKLPWIQSVYGIFRQYEKRKLTYSHSQILWILQYSSQHVMCFLVVVTCESERHDFYGQTQRSILDR